MEKITVSESSKLIATFSAFPTVLVTSGNNIITVTLVHIFSFAPPLIGIGIKPERYSHHLIKESKEFVINIPTKNLLSATIFCGAQSGRKVDKFKETGLTQETSLSVKTVSIKECPVNIECKVVQEINCGDRTWFIGEIIKGKIAKDYNLEDTILYWRGIYRLPGAIIK
ncbi:MAG: flavin reductase family protein [candidate division WOR-3 bacterium]|nr:flavin reductase family protein [candidate division WOR-3 bacterium]